MASQLRTLTPELVDANIAYSKDFLKKYSNYLNLVGGFLNELEVAINYRKTFVTNDIVNEKKSFLSGLVQKLANFNDEFSVYWHEQYQTMLDVFKSDDAKEYFDKNSDSIGLITNTRNLIADSTSPVFDIVFSNTRGQPPLYLAANSYNKISPKAKLMLAQASIQANAIFRNNISLAQVKQAKSTDAHGVNLVTDFQHYVRIRDKVQSQITKSVLDAVKKRIKLVQFYSNINDVDGFNYVNYDVNKQKIEFTKIKLNIENIEYDVDLLTNRIRQVKSRIFNDAVLSIENFDAKTKKTERTTEELDKIYGSNNILTVIQNISGPVLFGNSSPITQGEKNNKKAKTVDELKASAKVSESEQKPKNDGAYESKVAAGNEQAKTLPTALQTAPPTIQYPFYDSPDWANGILNCLGITGIVNAFKDMGNIFTNPQDFLKTLDSLNPFGDIMGLNISSLFNPTQLLNQIQNFDLTSIAGMFGLNIPLPPISISTLMNPKDLFDETLQMLQDTLIDTLESQLTQMLNAVCPGGGGGGVGSSLGGALGGVQNLSNMAAIANIAGGNFGGNITQLAGALPSIIGGPTGPSFPL